MDTSYETYGKSKAKFASIALSSDGRIYYASMDNKVYSSTDIINWQEVINKKEEE